MKYYIFMFLGTFIINSVSFYIFKLNILPGETLLQMIGFSFSMLIAAILVNGIFGSSKENNV